MANFSKSIREVWQEKFVIPSPVDKEIFDFTPVNRTLEDGTIVVDFVKSPVSDRYKGLRADMWSVDVLLETGNAAMLQPVGSLKTSPLGAMDSIASNVDPESIVLPKSE